MKKRVVERERFEGWQKQFVEKLPDRKDKQTLQVADGDALGYLDRPPPGKRRR